MRNRSPTTPDGVQATNSETPRGQEGGGGFSSNPVSSPTTKLTEQTLPEKAAYHFSMGQAHSLEGDSNQAIEDYKLALVYDPDSAIIRTRLASEYVKRGLLTFAIEQCKKAISLDPKQVDARLLLAGLYATTKLTPEAMEQYDAVLKIDPQNAEAYVFKGSLLLEEGQPTKAVGVLEKLVSQDADYFLAYYYLGRAYQRLNQDKKAILSYKKALQLKNSFSQAAMALALLYEEKKQIDLAVKVYEELYEATGDVQVVSRLAQVHLDHENYGKALQYLQQLKKMDPENLNVQVKIGLIHVQNKNLEEAARAFQEILERTPEAEKVRYYLASVYEEMKRFSVAIEEFKKIPASSSVYVDATLHVGILYKLNGDLDKALSWIDAAIAKQPSVAQLYLLKAAVLEEDKKLDEAIASLESVKIQFSGDERILYFLGSLYDRKGEPDKALEFMHSILIINPNHVQALNYVGYTYTVQRSKLDEAEQYIQRARKLKPNDPYIEDSYGFLLVATGKSNEAIIVLEKARLLKPDEAVIVEHLADAYVRSSLKRKALQIYADAERLFVEPQDKMRLEKKIDELQKSLTRAVATEKNKE